MLNDLFLILFLLSLVALPIGLIKPSIVKMESRKKVLKFLGGSVILFFILFGVTIPAKTQNNQPQSISPEQKLENDLKGIKAGISTDFSFKKLELEKSDVTIDINLSSFWDEKGLLRDTGDFTSITFQTTYNSNLPVSWVLVRYWSDTKDRYGKVENNVVLSYSIDKETYQKIQWDNFDQDSLCKFLRDESKLQSDINKKFEIDCTSLISNISETINNQ